MCIHPDLVPASRLTPLLRRGDKPGFVVEDMTDLDDFEPTEAVDVPDRPLYLLRDVERGDEYRGVTPDDALPQVQARGRTRSRSTRASAGCSRTPTSSSTTTASCAWGPAGPRRGARPAHAGDLDQPRCRP